MFCIELRRFHKYYLWYIVYSATDFFLYIWSFASHYFCCNCILTLIHCRFLSVGLTSSLWGHSLYQGIDWCSRMFLSLVPHQEPFGVSWSGSENSCGPLGVCEFQIRNPWGKTDQLLCDVQILSLSVCKDIQNVTTVFIYIYIYLWTYM